MRAIYLDNYRGFSKELIPIKAVNFLVGENSTGKTSFLSALKIFGSRKFWFNPSFDDPDLQFSQFSEIVSKKSENKLYFSVGFFDDTKNDEDDFPIFKLITFKKEEGVPVVHKYSFNSPIGLISTVISNNSLRYKVVEGDNQDSQVMLNYCVKEHSKSHPSGYRMFANEGFPRELFFANAYHFIVADMAGKDLLKDSKNLTIEYKGDIPSCRWIAPIRAKPEKVYIRQFSNYSPEGEHIPYVINRLIGKGSEASNSKALNSLKKFGNISGLFESISIKRFGKEVSSPFEINVNVDGRELLISNVGYGVSQVLPIILESRRKSIDEFIAIQQPEVHLHPKAQAALGEFIYDAKSSSDNNFLIETHSDYLIDRYRLCTNRNGPQNAQILFFERKKKGNKVHTISINDDGSYSDEQPSVFRDFFLNEELELLRL